MMTIKTIHCYFKMGHSLLARAKYRQIPMHSFSCLNWDSFPPQLMVVFSFEQTCFMATVTQTSYRVRNICITFKTIPSKHSRDAA